MHGKLIFKTAIMLAIMIGLANYGFYVTTGKTLVSRDALPKVSLDSLPKVSLDSLPAIELPNLNRLTPSLPADKDTVYKWKDLEGNIHYTSEPPDNADNIVAEKLEVDPNTNLIQGIDVPEESEQAEAIQAPSPKISTPTPQGAQKLIEDARNVQTLLDERYREQQRAIGDL